MWKIRRFLRDKDVSFCMHPPPHFGLNHGWSCGCGMLWHVVARCESTICGTTPSPRRGRFLIQLDFQGPLRASNWMAGMAAAFVYPLKIAAFSHPSGTRHEEGLTDARCGNNGFLTHGGLKTRSITKEQFTIRATSLHTPATFTTNNLVMAKDFVSKAFQDFHSPLPLFHVSHVTFLGLDCSERRIRISKRCELIILCPSCRTSTWGAHLELSQLMSG